MWTILGIIMVILAAMYAASQIFFTGLAILAVLAKWSFWIVLFVAAILYIRHRLSQKG